MESVSDLKYRLGLHVVMLARLSMFNVAAVGEAEEGCGSLETISIGRAETAAIEMISAHWLSVRQRCQTGNKAIKC